MACLPARALARLAAVGRELALAALCKFELFALGASKISFSDEL